MLLLECLHVGLCLVLGCLVCLLQSSYFVFVLALQGADGAFVLTLHLGDGVLELLRQDCVGIGHLIIVLLGHPSNLSFVIFLESTDLCLVGVLHGS